MSHFLPTAKNKSRLLLVLCLTLAISLTLSLPLGPFGFEIELFTKSVLFKDTISLRGSRILLAMLAGAALGTTGSTLQAVLRNPLADPFIIGVAGGAALGGAICIGLFPALTSATPVFAIIGALTASFALYRLFMPQYTLKTESILLAGVAFNMFAASFITLMKVLLPTNKSQALLFWLIGSVPYITYSKLLLIAFIVITGCALLIRLSPGIEILSQGDDEAARLGLDVSKVKKTTYLLTSIILGITISYTGMIGFIGLIVPNVLRIFCGPNQNILLPASMLLGAILLVLFDALSRYLFFVFQSQMPVGALTTLLGAPIFLWLILRKTRFGKSI